MSDVRPFCREASQLVLENYLFKDKWSVLHYFVLKTGDFKDKYTCIERFLLETGNSKDKHMCALCDIIFSCIFAGQYHTRPQFEWRWIDDMSSFVRRF